MSDPAVQDEERERAALDAVPKPALAPEEPPPSASSEPVPAALALVPRPNPPPKRWRPPPRDIRRGASRVLLALTRKAPWTAQ